MKIKINGAMLKKKRTEAGKTRDDLLVALKQQSIPVSGHTLNDWEQGRRTPKQIQLLFAMAELLEFDAKDIILIEGDDDENNSNCRFDTTTAAGVPENQETNSMEKKV